MSQWRMHREKFVCIWLEKSPDRSNNYVDIQTIFPSIQTFHSAHQCADYIDDLTDKKAVLITTDAFAQEIIPVIHAYEQVYSVYLFVSKQSINQAWIEPYPKIQGLFHDRQQLVDQIKKDITQYHTDAASISFLSSNNINQQDPSFMYSQLLKEIILNDHKDEQEEVTRQDMLRYCRHVNENDAMNLNIIDEFDRNFIPELSVYWYTRECFLYKMLNKALWKPKPHVLYKLRYFLRHLHQQIVSQAELQRANRLPMTVYRGQNVSLDHIEKLKRNIGGFLSFNNYVSTSVRREVAITFLSKIKTGVLFEMKVDPSIDRFPFANIKHLSYQQGMETEEELLFSMGTVFRIQNVNKDDDFYTVQLILSADIDEELEAYTKKIREHVRSSHSFLSLLKLMEELSQFDSIKHFIEVFREDETFSTNAHLLGSIHHAFGTIHNGRGQGKEALDQFQQALSQYLTILPRDHPKLSPTYNNIGSAHVTQSNYETALSFFQLAIDCQANSPTPDISSLVTYINNMGSVYFQLDQFNKALEYYKRALDVQLKHRDDDHSALISMYNVISIIYYQLKDPQQAEFYHDKALTSQKWTTQFNPIASIAPLLTTGTLCIAQKQYQQALVHFNQALKIQQRYLLPNNPEFFTTFDCIANAYFNIPKGHAGLSQWTSALTYDYQAMKQTRQANENDRSQLFLIIQHLAYIFEQQENYDEALDYYQQAINIQTQFLPVNRDDLITIYDHMANIYLIQGRTENALIYYKKALAMEQQLKPDAHLSIALSYMNIAKVYADSLCWSDALEYGLNAVQHMKISSQADASTLAPLIQYISYIYRQQCDYQQVIIYSHEALNLYTTYLSDDDPSLLRVYNRISHAYYTLKQYRKSIPFYQKIITIELKTLANDAKTIGVSYLNLSTAYMDLENFDEALSTGSQALDQLLKTLPHNHPEVVRVQIYLNAIKIRQILETDKGC
ncbi:unnamed protein product [Adineta ricciae]|uniref:NAD(P)(+)--arginine ADP-ribosyltransferase n=1 Tax=Adineta ricciae TaxID=249248 RepID=A0A813UP01_ADIRI|nr:unnamed protein product [Adineta ricciae]CAF0977789.1 unnamed protein product [Adineta ricciae]